MHFRLFPYSVRRVFIKSFLSFSPPSLQFPVSSGKLFGLGDNLKEQRPAILVDVSGAVMKVVLLKKQASGSKTVGFPIISTAFPTCLTICTTRLSPQPSPYSPVSPPLPE
jgi:hypothetical protein